MGTQRGLLQGWRLASVILGAIAGVLAVVDLSIFLAAQLPGISGSVAAMLTGVATLALAALTGAIIVVNAGVLEATRKASEATREQASATKEQAKLAARSIREIQIDRELDWRPFVVRTEGDGRIVKGKLVRDITIQNIGRGPAINALYLRQEASPNGAVFLRTGILNLAVGLAVAVPAEQADEDHPKLFFGQTDSPRELLVCHDQFGNYLCFLPGSAGLGVWREERDERGILIQGEEEPPWVTAMKDILWGGHTRAEIDLEPGYAFQRAVAVQGAYAFCHSTVALEAVPALDLEPTDEMRDTVEHWMLVMQPGAEATSPTVARWQVAHPSKMGDAWAGWLSAGPMIGVLKVLDIETKPLGSGGALGGDVPLSDLVKWWERVVREGMAVSINFGVRRWRLGLTLVTSASSQQTELVDVNFAGLPRPQRWLQVPTHEIPNWSYRSRPFDAFPASDLDAAVREVLRMFGYREVDEVLEAINL